ncbi:MAG: DUF4445 domain-containing protein [Clostridia bacterium]|nr:DUF4445 domain-containing protein [Clostridia bacterium]
MSNTVTVRYGGREIPAGIGQTLSEITKGEKPCGGHGKCGKCKVIARGALSALSDAERKHLTPEEQEGGVRLACLARVEGDCTVEPLHERETSQIVTEGTLPAFLLDPTFSHYGVAIDVGTTTLAARLYDVCGKLLAQTSGLNPQSEWGADVISRIEASLAGKGDLLAGAIRGALDRMTVELANEAGIIPTEIDGVCITGNTVMLSLLTGESCEPFSHAPFAARRLFGETVTAGELSLSALSPETPVYLPACISAFVGADTTCAILATELCGGGTAMLADIGTNGEMALYCDGRLTVCSTAAGPAFEGVGISMGMRGAVGAIDKVTVENGVISAHVIGDGAPVGICGSGLVDAVACMLQGEILDESGFLEDEPFTVREPVTLTQKDVRMLQIAKSAICAGLCTLLDSEGLRADQIPRFLVAGGFGSYLNRTSAARIGLLPTALAENLEAVGNAALAGASMLLLGAAFREKTKQMSKEATVLDLSTSSVFSDRYMSGMILEECEV